MTPAAVLTSGAAGSLVVCLHGSCLLRTLPSARLQSTRKSLTAPRSCGHASKRESRCPLLPYPAAAADQRHDSGLCHARRAAQRILVESLMIYLQVRSFAFFLPLCAHVLLLASVVRLLAWCAIAAVLRVWRRAHSRHPRHARCRRASVSGFCSPVVCPCCCVTSSLALLCRCVIMYTLFAASQLRG